MIITPWKCIQSSYVSYIPVYNSYYRERTGKRMELSISNCTRQSTRRASQQLTRNVPLTPFDPVKIASLLYFGL